MTTTIRAKNTTCRLRINDRWRHVPCVVYGSFAVRASAYAPPSQWSYVLTYSIHHVATGQEIATIIGQRSARKLARYLNAALIDGDLDDAFWARAVPIIREYLGETWQPWER